MHSPQPVLLKSRITVISLAFLLCSIPTHFSAQQAKPDLSGKWKLNTSKSKLEGYHAEEYRIKHSEPRLVMEYTLPFSTETYSYITDGEERLASSSSKNGVTRGKAYWDGDTLVIEGRNDRSRGSWIARYTLSQDARSLVVAEHFNKSSVSSAFDELLTFDKRK